MNNAPTTSNELIERVRKLEDWVLVTDTETKILDRWRDDVEKRLRDTERIVNRIQFLGASLSVLVAIGAFFLKLVGK